ncbi:MAG: hypothetical protein QM530_01180 [Phycisphaerales bacterium]|nr:hypothetical protein [Phycisphaerales bacterium]
MGFKDGFIDSLFPSFSEDLIFFGTGFVGLLISTKLLRDESYDIRVSSLANGENISENADFYLKERLIDLLSYNADSKITIQLLRLDESKKYLQIHVVSEHKITNMCKEDKMPTNISMFVEPGPNVDGEIGQMVMHKLTYIKPNKKNGNETQKEEYIIPFGGLIDFKTLKDKRYVIKNFIADIPENGYVIQSIAYRFWLLVNGEKSNSDSWFFILFKGYTENFQLTVVNKMDDIDIAYSCKFARNMSQLQKKINPEAESIAETIDNKTINRQSSEVVTNGLELYFVRNDKFSIYFEKLQKEEKNGTEKKH